MKKRFKNKKLSQAYIQGAAYRYLERYATTEANLFFILRRKVERILADQEDVEEVRQNAETWINETVQKCVKMGLVDDRLYAESKFNSFMLSGNSLAQIKNKLRTKGVPQDIIAELIEAAKNDQPDLNFKSAIKYARKRRFGPFRIREEQENTRNKEIAAMARAGFSYDETNRVLSGDRNELEDILYG
ncbi:regulatory protein RecX [Pseudemcibacter aquimaris]|uniref:regulatory protein RecX n=1 Tax=Pseudemcibacter aquimaris TaxID=2857064 RepID=UPI002011ED5E|nr:regulatory protein RecX [Pseudemcibacter aquimaris]MCC3860645.1 recombination regulator RecX [Pseudemcibacter aquimaris]WDU59464.1 recombination regulator RecX [Pseudemcibacter aquimaris]